MSEPDPTRKYRVFVPFTDEQLEELDMAHGDIRRVTGAVPPAKSWRPTEVPEPHWEVVFGKPAPGQHAFFERHAHSPEAKDRALRLYAKATVVGVSYLGKVTMCTNRLENKQKVDIERAWDTLCEKFPGVHMAAQDEIMDLAGMGKDEAGKG